MKTKYLLATATALVLFLINVNLLQGQSWTLTGALSPVTNWTYLAMSADGTRLVAAIGFYSGGIYISTNSGNTWNLTSAPSNIWTSVASSADGSKLIAAASHFATAGPIFTSTNYGATWNQANVRSNIWSSVASSADGIKLVAATRGSSTPTPIYTSADSGVSWTSNGWPSPMNWNCVASSSDGSILAAAGESSSLYVSTNSGTAWYTIKTPIYFPQAVAASADGKTLIVGGAGLFITTNFGATWKTNFSAEFNYSPVACSADGSRLLVAEDGTIYQTSRSGANWTSTSVGSVIRSVVSSADGNELAVTASDGGIWMWRATPVPKLNITSTSNGLAFCWPIPSANFMLQQNFNLNTKNWVTLTNTPTLDLTSLENHTVLSLTATNCFYRLISTP